jgi:hypothetical protein
MTTLAQSNSTPTTKPSNASPVKNTTHSLNEPLRHALLRYREGLVKTGLTCVFRIGKIGRLQFKTS